MRAGGCGTVAVAAAAVGVVAAATDAVRPGGLSLAQARNPTHAFCFDACASVVRFWEREIVWIDVPVFTPHVILFLFIDSAHPDTGNYRLKMNPSFLFFLFLFYILPWMTWDDRLLA